MGEESVTWHSLCAILFAMYLEDFKYDGWQSLNKSHICAPRKNHVPAQQIGI
jgi:hypothetical protein